MALLMVLLYPILSGMSRRHSTASRLAPGRGGGAAAPPWALVLLAAGRLLLTLAVRKVIVQGG